MKTNYLLYIFLIGVVLFREPVLNATNNLTRALFIKEQNLEVELMENKNNLLVNEYQALLDFKNNITLNYEYTITNVVKNNYGFHNLIVNGTNYKVGDEVVNAEGLIGIVSAVNKATSEIKYIYNTNIVVSIEGEIGKITGKDAENNLIVKEISNYNNIKLNDIVYSTYGTYIGKVIKIKYETLDNYLTIKTNALNNINYVAIISR